MQICLVNMVDLDPPHNGGISRVALLVSRLLAEQARTGGLRIVFLVGWRFASAFRDWSGISDAPILPVLTGTRMGPIMRALRPDFLVSPLFGMAPVDDIEGWGDIPHIVSIPDALALDMPEIFSETEAERRRDLYRALPRARLVVTLSEDARYRLLRHVNLEPDKVKVIPLAGDLPPERVDPDPVIGNIRDPYVFYPANAWPHKRHEFLLQIMVEIWKTRPELHLVLTGLHPVGYINELAALHACPPEKIIDLGYLEDDRLLPSLYRRAEALLFVSEYEGFGIPVLEAMSKGCPVICAPLTSLPEVAGDAALFVESKRPSDWASMFLKVLPGRRAELISRGHQQAQKFSWSQTEQRWKEEMIKAGLDLAHSPSVPDGKISLTEISDELLRWSARIKELDQALTAKEAIIRSFKESPFYWLMNGPFGRLKFVRNFAIRIKTLYHSFRNSR